MCDVNEFAMKYPDFCRRLLIQYINNSKGKRYIDTYLKFFDLYLVHQKSIKNISDELSLNLSNAYQYKRTIMKIINNEINYSEDYNTNDYEMLKIDIDSIVINLDNFLDNIIDQKIIHDYLIMIIDNYLTEREQYVITRRLGIYDGYDYSLSEIGMNLSIGPERIRQIEKKAIRKIGHYFYKKYKLGRKVNLYR